MTFKNILLVSCAYGNLVCTYLIDCVYIYIYVTLYSFAQASVLEVIRRTPIIDFHSEESKALERKSVQGHICFEKVNIKKLEFKCFLYFNFKLQSWKLLGAFLAFWAKRILLIKPKKDCRKIAQQVSCTFKLTYYNQASQTRSINFSRTWPYGCSVKSSYSILMRFTFLVVS